MQKMTSFVKSKSYVSRLYAFWRTIIGGNWSSTSWLVDVLRVLLICRSHAIWSSCDVILGAGGGGVGVVSTLEIVGPVVTVVEDSVFVFVEDMFLYTVLFLNFLLVDGSSTFTFFLKLEVSHDYCTIHVRWYSLHAVGPKRWLTQTSIVKIGSIIFIGSLLTLVNLYWNIALKVCGCRHNTGWMLEVGCDLRIACMTCRFILDAILSCTIILFVRYASPRITNHIVELLFIFVSFTLRSILNTHGVIFIFGKILK